MKSYFVIVMPAILFVSTPSFGSEGWRQATENPDYIHRSLKKITDIIVADIFSPPVASRIYAYVSIAGYETAIHGKPEYITLAGQIPHLKPVPEPKEGKVYSFTLASVHAMLSVGKTLVFSSEEIETFRREMMQELRSSGIQEEVFENSIAYGNQVAGHILAWSAEDAKNTTLIKIDSLACRHSGFNVKNTGWPTGKLF